MIKLIRTRTAFGLFAMAVGLASFCMQANVAAAADSINIGRAELLYMDSQMPLTMDASFATLKLDSNNMQFFENDRGVSTTPLRYHGPLDAPLQTHDANASMDFSGFNTGNTGGASGLWIPNIYDDGSGTLIGLTHREDYTGGGGFFAIGLSKSTDKGASWKYLGDVLRPYVNNAPSPDFGYSNIGGVPYLIVGSYMYVYFNEHTGITAAGTKKLAVARALASDVVAAASNNTVPLFYKYANGVWTENGLTGNGDNIIPGGEILQSNQGSSLDFHSDAAYCTPLGKYLITVQTHSQGKLLLFTSADGINWGDETIVDYTPGVMQPYSCFASLNSDASSDCRVVGSEFYLYYPCKDYNNYGVDTLYRRRITIGSVQGTNLVWDPNGNGADGAGPWNASNLVWANPASGGADIVWRNSANDIAVFGAGSGAAGAVTVNGTLTAGGVTFNATGSGNYTLSGGALTFSGAPVIAANIDATIGSVLAGAAFTKTGAGTLTLSGINTFAGYLVNDAGGLTISGAGQLGSGTYANNIENNGTFTFASSASQTLSGVIIGAGAVKVTGPGTLTLSAQQELITGSVAVNGGKLVLANKNAGNVGLYGCSGLTIAGGTVQLNNDNALSGSAGNAGNVVPVTIQSGGVLTGSGTSVNLRGVLTLAGGALASSGTVRTDYGSWDLCNGVAAGGVAGTSIISASAVLPNQSGGTVFNVSSGAANGIDLDVTGTLINGTSAHDTGVIKTGNGVMRLSGTNTYIGTTTINGGTLNLTGSLAAGSAVVVNNGGTLAGTGTAAGATTVAGGGMVAPALGGTAGTLNLASLTLNAGAVLNMDLLGTGTSDKIALSGSLTASGTTTINLNTLAGFAGAGTYPLISGTGTINAANFAVGTVPAGYGYVLSASNGVLSVTVVVAPGTPTGLAATAGNGQVGLSWTASSGATSYNVKRSTTSGTGYTTIINTSALSYNDTGIINETTYYYVVSAVNVAGESANSSQANATPSPSIPAVTSPVITSATSASGTVSRSLSYQITATNSPTSFGAGSLPAGLSVNTSTGLISGTPTTAGTSNASLSATNAGGTGGATLAMVVAPAASFACTWSGTGANALWQSAANWDTLPIAGDTLYFAGSTQLSNTSDYAAGTQFNGITFNSGAGAFALNGNALTLAGDVVNNSTSLQTINLAIALTGSTRTLNAASGNIALNGVISGSTGIVKTGTGSLTFSGTNTYTGGTTVSSGILQINTSAAALQGAAAVNSGATLFLNVNNTTFANNLSGSGTVNATSPSASGALWLTGNLASFTGTLEVNGGGGSKLVYGATSQTQASLISSAAVIKVRSGNTFFAEQSNGTNALNFAATIQLYGAGNSENYGALRFDKDGANWSGPVVLYGNSTIGTQTNGTTPIISGTISESGGSFGLTKQGVGVMAISGNNTYTGTTTVSGGTLKLSGSLALQNSTLASGGIVFDSAVASHAFTFGGITGATALSLQDSASNPVALTLGNNNGSTTYSGVLSGTGSLTKTGTGTLILSGSNSYAGNTTVSGGTLRMTAMPVLPSGLKVMPIGDSITFGYNGTNAGYRGPLYNLLSAVAPGMQYVGTSTQGAVTTSSAPLPSTQRNNDGHSSYQINDVCNNLDGLDLNRYNQYGGADRYPNGGHWFDGATYTPYGGGSAVTRAAIYPDIITLMIGTNDLGTDSATLQSNLHALLVKITSQRPACKIFIAKITPRTDATTVITSYNEIVASEVASLKAAGKLIYLVDLNTGYPSSNGVPILADTVHPTDPGFNWMAQQWYNAIVSVCSTGNGPSTGVPSNSVTTVAAGAALDLNGTQLTVGSLTGAGSVTTGAAGALSVSSASSGTFSGVISGNGSVTKAGSGTLTLSGANTFTGATAIASGTLKLSGSGSISASSAIAVASGATIDAGAGSAAVNGRVTLAPGSAVLNLQNGAAATQALNGGLTLNGGNGLNFDVGSTADCLALGGAYTAPVSGNVTVNINGITGYVPGSYNLIAGASGISADSFTLGSVPTGHLYALVANAGTLSLVVDGIEAWRLAHFGTTSNTGNAADSADPDGDGWTNAQEFASGTDPNDRTSLLKVDQMKTRGSDLLLSFPTVSGKTYRVERSDTLQAGSWTTVQANIPGTGGTVQVTDTAGAAQPKRFYRIVVTP